MLREPRSILLGARSFYLDEWSQTATSETFTSLVSIIDFVNTEIGINEHVKERVTRLPLMTTGGPLPINAFRWLVIMLKTSRYNLWHNDVIR